jgi:hypothetical protein
MSDDNKKTPPSGVPRARGDEKTPLGGTKKPATPRGVPILPRHITERGGGLDRDVQKPKHGRMDPAFDFEGATDQYEGEELERIRSRRPTDQRIGHIEKKFDKLEERVEGIEKKIDGVDDSVTEVRIAVARVEATLTSELKSTSTAIRLLEGELKANRENKHMIVQQTLDISQTEAKGKTERLIIATKGKWKAIVAVVSGVFSVSVLSAIIALLASGKC